DLLARVCLGRAELAEVGEQVVRRGDRLSHTLVERLLVQLAWVREVGRGLLDLVAPVADARAEVVRPLLRRRLVAAAPGGQEGERSAGDRERPDHTPSEPDGPVG